MMSYFSETCQSDCLDPGKQGYVIIDHGTPERARAGPVPEFRPLVVHNFKAQNRLITALSALYQRGFGAGAARKHIGVSYLAYIGLPQGHKWMVRH